MIHCRYFSFSDTNEHKSSYLLFNEYIDKQCLLTVYLLKGKQQYKGSTILVLSNGKHP